MTKRKLPSGARTPEQEYARDVEMRLADPRRTEQRRAAARKDLREHWAKEDAAWAAPLAPNLTRVASGDLRKTSTTKRLRHGARTPEQEYDRDVEMRDALKVAKKQADKTWRTLVDTIPKGLNLEKRAAWMAARISEHGDLRALEKVARATARKTLRERWAKEDAASAGLRP